MQPESSTLSCATSRQNAGAIGRWLATFALLFGLLALGRGWHDMLVQADSEIADRNPANINATPAAFGTRAHRLRAGRLTRH